MLLVAAKTLLTPLLLALCTVVSHKWGDVVGGWLLGLPLVSGPISLFLMLQHGPLFAESAARSSLLGFVAVGVFCLTYLALADNGSWQFALGGAVAACVGSIALLSLVHLALIQTIVAVALALLAMNALVGGAEASPAEVAGRSLKPSRRGVVGRMALSGALVLTLTTCSGALGGPISGLLAPLPVLAALMAAAVHRRQGACAVRGLLRGLAVGMWGGVAFFGIVGLLLGSVAPVLAYATAVTAAALAGWVATRVAARRPALRLQRHLQEAALARSVHRSDGPMARVALVDQLSRVDAVTLKQAYCGRERLAA